MMVFLIDHKHFHRFPFGVALIQSLFSKMLGARPQGTWMGIMSATGSISGIIGKKSASNLKTHP